MPARSEQAPAKLRYHRVVAALLVACSVASALCSQPKRLRQTHAHVMELRRDLWRELAESPPELRRAVVAAMGEKASNPLLPLARALALVREVEPDDLFRLRHGLIAFATPEVVDLDHYAAVHLTVHVPYRLPWPAQAVEFRARIRDAEGAERWQGTIACDGLDDLLRYRVATAVPVEDLDDGTYEVEIAMWADGEAPRAADPVSTATFHVMRGFAERVRLLGERAAQVFASGDADPADVLVVKGALAAVNRAFLGEPPEGRSRVPLELQQATELIDQLERGEPALGSTDGWVQVAVATGDQEAATVAVDLAAERDPGGALVMFVPGAPTLGKSSRPTTPDFVAPGWLRDELARVAFGRERGDHIAVLESPGRMRNSGAAVIAVVAELKQLLGGERVVLVGEREGAVAISRAITMEPELADGVVLVCGGMLSREAAEQVADRRWLVALGAGHASRVNLGRAVTWLRDAGATVEELPADLCPWTYAIAPLLPAIDAFVASR